MTAPDAFSLQWGQFGTAVAAVGSLGLASFGVVESLGKVFAFCWTTRRGVAHQIGLPYAGFGLVRKMLRPLWPALEIAYGQDAVEIVAQQYYAGRSQGRAPDTIRQGVRLALPFMGVHPAANLIASTWRMERQHAEALAAALQADGTNPPQPPQTGPSAAIDPAQALAGRFATALDARINAAFALADQRYETWAKTLAGGAAIALAFIFNWGLKDNIPWPIVLGIGAVAVPLGPVAKDVSTSLQNALTAFKAIPSKVV